MIVRRIFTEISGKKKELKKPARLEKVNNTMNIEKVERGKIGDTDILRFKFAFKTEYVGGKQTLAELNVKGEVWYTDKPEKLAEIEKQWKKEKKLEPRLMEAIMNTAFEGAQIVAINLAKDLEIPLPVRLMRVRFTKPREIG